MPCGTLEGGACMVDTTECTETRPCDSGRMSMSKIALKEVQTNHKIMKLDN